MEEGCISMCFHLANQSIQVNLTRSLVRDNRKGKSYIGVFNESIKVELVLKFI